MTEKPTRDYYTRYPRTILWLVAGGELCLESDERGGPSRTVRVEPFYIGKFPITNEQYEAYASGFERGACSPGDRDPVVGVSLEDAAGYCEWYAGVARKPMRLPTEIEWEYACRGGSESRYFWGDALDLADSYLWDAANSDGRVPILDHKKANPFGLYGMLGGVWEWTVDAKERGVLRGGSFLTPRNEISCGLRRDESANARFGDAGFRIVKSLRA